MALNKDKATNVAPEEIKEVAGGKEKAKGKGGKSAASRLISTGEEIYATLSDEQKQALGSKSGSLHFKYLLGLSSKKSSRKVGQETVECSLPVGVQLVTDEDIQVPVIDIKLDNETGIDPATQIEYRTVKAGEDFFLSYYEFMFLILRDEYAGMCEANGDDNGAYFSAKANAFFDGLKKLPTPTINLRKGSSKENMVDIDEKGPDGNFVIKEPYTEKFTPLITKKRASRAGGKKASIPAPKMVSLALQKIIGVK